MSISFAILIGILFAVGVYLLLRRSIVDLIFGVIVLGHACNLVVFGSGGLQRGMPPFADGTGPIGDALPQALVLTAIVIGFGVAAFAIVLVDRLYTAAATDDHDKLEEDRGA